MKFFRETQNYRVGIGRGMPEEGLVSQSYFEEKGAGCLENGQHSLYGWGREPDITKMEMATSPIANAIGPALIATTPEQMRNAANAKRQMRNTLGNRSFTRDSNDRPDGPPVEKARATISRPG